MMVMVMVRLVMVEVMVVAVMVLVVAMVMMSGVFCRCRWLVLRDSCRLACDAGADGAVTLMTTC